VFLGEGQKVIAPQTCDRVFQVFSALRKLWLREFEGTRESCEEGAVVLAYSPPVDILFLADSLEALLEPVEGGEVLG
jgi:hypothetical protein